MPPLQSSPWVGRVGGCSSGPLRPVVPRLNSGPRQIARAPRPALESRWRSVLGASSPGGNNGAKAGAPEAGREEGARPPPGVCRPGPPSAEAGSDASRSSQTPLHRRAGPGAAALPTAALVPRAPRGAPRTREKSSAAAALPAAGKARSPQCAMHRPFGPDASAQLRTQPGFLGTLRLDQRPGSTSAPAVAAATEAPRR